MRRQVALTVALFIAAAACGSGSGNENAVDSTATPVTGVPTTGAPVTAIPVTDPPVAEAETAAPSATEPATIGAPSTTAAPALGIGPATVEALLALATPINLSHAGGDQAAPHSTMFAFREGVLAGADALEMDVQLTGDGVLIVQHDDTVDK